MKKYADGGKGKKKQAKLKTRKSIGGGGSDDDFKPVNVAVSKKNAGPKKLKDDDKEGVIKPTKSKPRAKVIKSDSDVEMEQPQEKAKAKSKAKAKETIDIASDDDNGFISPKSAIENQSKLEMKRKRCADTTWFVDL